MLTRVFYSSKAGKVFGKGKEFQVLVPGVEYGMKIGDGKLQNFVDARSFEVVRLKESEGSRGALALSRSAQEGPASRPKPQRQGSRTTRYGRSWLKRGHKIPNFRSL